MTTIIDKRIEKLQKRIKYLEERLAYDLDNPTTRRIQKRIYSKLFMEGTLNINVPVSEYEILKEQYAEAQRVISLYQAYIGSLEGYPQLESK